MMALLSTSDPAAGAVTIPKGAPIPNNKAPLSPRRKAPLSPRRVSRSPRPSSRMSKGSMPVIRMSTDSKQDLMLAMEEAVDCGDDVVVKKRSSDRRKTGISRVSSTSSRNLSRSSSARNLSRNGSSRSLKSSGSTSSLADLASGVGKGVVHGLESMGNEVWGGLEAVGVVDNGPGMQDHLSDIEAFCRVLKGTDKDAREEILRDAIVSKAEGGKRSSKAYKKKVQRVKTCPK